MLKFLWLRTHYFLYWQIVSSSWGKSRTIHWLSPLCHSSRVLLIVYCDRLYQRLFLRSKKTPVQYFPASSCVCIFSLIDISALLVGNQTKQVKSNFVFPENCSDVYTLILLLSYQYWKERKLAYSYYRQLLIQF